MDKKIFKEFVNEQVVDNKYGDHTTLTDEQRLGISTILDDKFNLNLKKYHRLYLKDEDCFEKLKEAVPENFCIYPFTHLQLDPDGRVRPCCKYKVGDSSWQDKVPKMPELNIEQLWNQPELQELRSAFLRNEKPSGCKACWDEEKAGMQSMRKLFNDGGKEYPETTFFQFVPRQVPKSLDLKLSNICNLKCRICNAFLSSQWIKEYKDLKLADKETIELYVDNSKEKFSANVDNTAIMKQWAKNIDHLEFYGGEPLLQQEHDDILNIFCEYGQPKNTRIFYNTNGTVCEEKFFKLWKNFDEVLINISVDDIEKRFEYQRKNAKWLQVKTNINLFKEYKEKYNVNLKLQLYVTIGIFNILYLEEILNELRKFDIPLVFNVVHYPHHFTLVNFPNNVKNEIKNKLENINVDGIEFLSWSPTVDNLIRYMFDREMNPEEYRKFWEYIEMHDNYRNESFSDTFPKLFELLRNNKI